MPCRGNPLTFFAYMGFFLIGITGIGICIGTICRNMLQAILLSFVVWFAGIFPAGIVTPIENMKPFLQKIGQGIPTTHFNIAANGIMQKGLGFAVLWPEAVKLIGIGAVFMMVGCFSPGDSSGSKQENGEFPYQKEDMYHHEGRVSCPRPAVFSRGIKENLS